MASLMKMELDLDSITAYDGDSLGELLRDEIKAIIKSELRRAAAEQQKLIRALCTKAVRDMLTPETITRVMKELDR